MPATALKGSDALPGPASVGPPSRGGPLAVALLPPLREPSRQSMDLYCRELRAAADPRRVSYAFPAGEGRVGSGGPLRYLRQYGLYTARALAARSGGAADVYHVTDHGYTHLVLALPPGRTVVNFHDALLPRLAEGSLPVRWRPRRAILAQRFALRLLPRVARVIVGSRFAREELLRFSRIDPGRVRVVPNGVAPEFAPLPGAVLDEGERARLRGEKGLGPGPLLLFVGRCDPHKNLSGAIRALSLLVREGRPDARLIRIGPGGIGEAERRLAGELGVGPRVADLGLVGTEELRALYGSCDALLHLSFYEGFGLTLLEAMACGLPVVAARAGSLPEVAGDAALLVDPSNPEEAARAVAAVIDRPDLRRELASRGSERARAFSWRRTAEATAEVYEEVAATARAAGSP